MKYMRRAGIALGISLLTGCLLCGIGVAGSEVGPTATPTPTPAGNMIGETAREPGFEPEPTEEPVPTMSYWDSEQANTYKALEVMKTDGTAGYGGYWKDADTEPGAFFIGVTKDADREKILARIPDSFREWIRFVDVKYTYAEVWETYEEIVKKYFTDIADENFRTDPEKQELVYAGFSEQLNVVEIGVLNDLPKERQDRVIAELFDRYGDKVVIELADPNEVVLDYIGGKEILYEGINHPVDSSFTAQPGTGYQMLRKITYADYRNDKKNTGHLLPIILVSAAVFAVGLAALCFGLIRARRRAAITTDGRTVSADLETGDGEIEALFKKASEDVSEEGRERIFTAYEKERREK